MTFSFFFMFGFTGRNGGSRDGHPSGLPRPYGGRHGGHDGASCDAYDAAAANDDNGTSGWTSDPKRRRFR